MNRLFALVLTVLLGVTLFGISLTDEETVPLKDADGLTNLALLPNAKARASSVYANGALAIHQIKHLNDGKYDNAHSWISAGEPSWVEVGLGEVCRVAKVVFGSEHNAHYKDRAATRFEILVATDSNATKWNRVLEYEGDPVRDTTAFDFEPTEARYVRVVILEGAGGEVRIDELEIYGHAAQDAALPFPKRTPTSTLLRRKQIAATLEQSRILLEKLASKGVNVSAEREQLNQLAKKVGETADADVERNLLSELRAFKRTLFFRNADVRLSKIVFVQRHIYNPSHIYTEYSDAPYRPGGVCVWSPDGTVKQLFDAGDGICRDPEVSFDGKKILFSYRKGAEGKYHLYEMNADGTGLKQLTSGPFHDMYPTYLPDGRIAFISTRCKSRVLCFTTESATLFAMNADNVNKYTPCVLPDGRILYTRWEYMDKGADYSQSLWAIRPDGTNVAHVFGNNITTPYSFLSARPIPNTGKFVCTFASHWGDHVGPIGIVDPSLGRNNSAAIRNLTPEIPIGVYKGYRDPYPLSEEYFLVSYAPAGRFGIYLMDAHGNRELLYEDKTFSSFQPIPLAPRLKPPVLPSSLDRNAKDATLLLLDVYRGLGDAVKRGTVKYLRIVEEYRHELPHRPDGTYQTNFGVLKANYVSPTDEVAGPFGWPTYMAKYVHGVVPVEADGSAYFNIPADKPIYFQALDANLNEIQRMRSYTHLKAGETQTCIGCHEERSTTPPNQKGQWVNGSMGQSLKQSSTVNHQPSTLPLALRRAPSKIAPPAWGAGVFSFKRIVQPVLDKHCVSCHSSEKSEGKVDLSWTLGADNVPASYRTLIRNGYVRYVDTSWHASNAMLKPLTFGTTQSKLIQLIDAHHYDARLTAAERERITTWIDLNCPLWDNYEPSLRSE